MAGGSAQPLDIRDIGGCRDHIGYIRLLHDRPDSTTSRHTLVRAQLYSKDRIMSDIDSRLFPFGVTTSALTLVFIIVILILAARRMLIPGVILLGSFILFVLWLTTLIETSIQLFGPAGNVNANCNTYVTAQEYVGLSVETLAWLTQNNICGCWKAVFSWSLIATSKKIDHRSLVLRLEADHFASFILVDANPQLASSERRRLKRILTTCFNAMGNLTGLMY